MSNAVKTKESVETSKLYTPEVVAEKLGVTPQSVRKWLRSNQLHGVKIGRLWRVRAEDLASFIEDPIAHMLDTAPIVEGYLTESDIRAIEKAEEAIRQGRVRPLEQVMRELGLDINR